MPTSLLYTAYTQKWWFSKEMLTTPVKIYKVDSEGRNLPFILISLWSECDSEYVQDCEMYSSSKTRTATPKTVAVSSLGFPPVSHCHLQSGQCLTLLFTSLVYELTDGRGQQHCYSIFLEAGSCPTALSESWASPPTATPCHWHEAICKTQAGPRGLWHAWSTKRAKLLKPLDGPLKWSSNKVNYFSYILYTIYES